MRRFLHLVASLLVIKDGYFMSTAGLSAVLAPILLNSCRNVQPEATTSEGEVARAQAAASERGASGSSPDAQTEDAPEPEPELSSTGESLEGGTVRPRLAGVTATASGSGAGPGGTTGSSRGISATTRRTARGLPEAFAGYASWNRLEAEGTVSFPGADDEWRAYIHLPLGFEATIGAALELPLARRTRIVIESKRAGDDFIRRIDTLEQGDLGWERRCFAREQSAEGFQEEAAGVHPDEADDAAAACRKLLASIEEGTASLILRE